MMEIRLMEMGAQANAKLNWDGYARQLMEKLFLANLSVEMESELVNSYNLAGVTMLMTVLMTVATIVPLKDFIPAQEVLLNAKSCVVMPF